MSPGNSAEDDHTDPRLPVERAAQADHALDERMSAVDDLTDVMISRSRARSDSLLAAARARIDGQLGGGGDCARATRTVERGRAREDEALRQERVSADQTLRSERAQHASLLVTEREGANHALTCERARSHDALATRDEFLSVVSHDLRGLLITMVGFAELIGQEEAREHDADTVHKYVQYIERSGARMNRLIGDLVDVAGISANRLALVMEVGDGKQIAKEAFELFELAARVGGISLTMEVDPASCPGSFDSARILQVLTNLLSNAIKFTPSPGKVNLSVTRVAQELRFAVSDSGPGIADDLLEAIFERYLQVTSNDRRGLGLGLYICRHIIQRHGGRIWAESVIGEGSTFTFTLPVHVTGLRQ